MLLPRKVWRALLVAHFAKDTGRPLVSACGRIGIGYGVCGVFGWLFAKAIAKAHLPAGMPPLLLGCIAAFAGFVLGGFLLLATNAAQSGSERGTNFQRILKMMPLSKLHYWAISVVPSLIVVGMVSVFGSQLVVAAGAIMGLSITGTIAAFNAGLLCGVGCVLLRKPRSLMLKGGVFVMLISTIGLLLDNSIQQYSPKRMHIVGLAITMLLGAMLSGFVQVYHQGLGLGEQRGGGSTRQLIPTVLPNAAWLVVKVWRNPRTRASLLLAMVLSGSAAATILLRSSAATNPYQVLVLSALFAAMFACDVRGIMRRYAPPEMVLLKGAKGVVRAELVSIPLVGVAIGLPLYMALHAHADNQLVFASSFLVIQMFASTCGLLASTLLVPDSGDTGMQFGAAVMASAILVMLPKFAGFSGRSQAAQQLRWLLASVVAGILVWSIEIIRRHNYGRS